MKSLWLIGSTAQNSNTKRDTKPDTTISSPKHRSSIPAAATNSVDHHGDFSVTASTEPSVSPIPTITNTLSGPSSGIQQQTSVEQSGFSNIKISPDPSSANEADEIVAEPLEKILEHKLVKEKRDALEKKLKTLRKNHDKEKLKASLQDVGDCSGKKSKFSMGNKLVKRLSSKNM